MNTTTFVNRFAMLMTLCILSFALNPALLLAESQEIEGTDNAHIDTYVNTSDPATTKSLGGLRMMGNNSSTTKTLYASIEGEVSDATPTSGSALIRFKTLKDGSTTAILELDGAGADLLLGNLNILGGTLVVGNESTTYTLPLARGGSDTYLKQNADGSTSWVTIDQIDNLDEIPDVDAASPTNGQALVWNSTSEKWEAQDVTQTEADTLALVTGRGDSTSVQVKLDSGAIVDGDLKAKDATGIGLKDDAGTVGVWVKAGGEVGIGITNPNEILEVAKAAASTGIRVHESSDSGNYPAMFSTFRSRGSDINSPTTISSGNAMGGVEIGAYDSSSFAAGAVIMGRAAQTWTASAHGTDLRFLTTDSGTATLDERMRIEESGEVGIGTTSPADPLHVKADSAGDNIHLEEYSGGEDWQLGVDSSGDLNFEDEGSVRVTFEDGGNVGIGTADPSTPLHVEMSNLFSGTHFSGTVASFENNGEAGISVLGSSNSYLFLGDASSETGAGAIRYNHGSDTMYLRTVGANRVTIASDGDVGIGTTAPAEKLHVNGTIQLSSTTTDETSGGKLWYLAVYAGSWIYEMRVHDGQGNDTTISPHNFTMFEPDAEDPLPWSFYSRNTVIGKEVNVNMSKAIRLLEQLSGEQLIYVQDLPAEEVQSKADWLATEKAQLEKTLIEQKIKELGGWIEVTPQDAVEDVEEEQEIIGQQTVERYRFNEATGLPELVQIQEEIRQTVSTGRIIKRIRSDCHMDEITGKFYQQVTADNVVLDAADQQQIDNRQLPAYVKDRLPAQNR